MRKRIVDFFFFLPIQTLIIRPRCWTALSRLGHFYSLPGNYPDIFIQLIGWLLAEVSSWTFQPTRQYIYSSIDCRDTILGILVVGTVGDIREPQKRKMVPSILLEFCSGAQFGSLSTLDTTLATKQTINLFSTGTDSQPQ